MTFITVPTAMSAAPKRAAQTSTLRGGSKNQDRENKASVGTAGRTIMKSAILMRSAGKIQRALDRLEVGFLAQ